MRMTLNNVDPSWANNLGRSLAVLEQRLHFQLWESEPGLDGFQTAVPMVQQNRTTKYMNGVVRRTPETIPRCFGHLRRTAAVLSTGYRRRIPL
jgi:hypothetical protein